MTQPGQQRREDLQDLQPREDESAELKGGGEVHVSGGGKRNDVGPGMDD